MTFLYATFLLLTNIFRIIINFSGPTPPDDYRGSTGNAKNPPYSYFIYHLYANLKVLNRLREAKGFNTLPLKPHAGEAGSRHHMATAFLLADSVNHGIKLQENPTLQYLFYLAQIGLATCPISNHALFMELDKSPIGGCAQPIYA